MKIKQSTLTALSIFALLYSVHGQETSKQGNTSKAIDSKPVVVKLTPVVFGGNRYVVETDFGLDKKVPMMVHGNASFYMMITHEIGEKLNGGNPIKKIRDFGYSDKKMGQINVQKFVIGGKTFTNAENVRVFDWPTEAGKSAQGMLGIDFLNNERVRIDFVKEEMEIGVALNDQPDKSLLAQGYSYTKIFVEKSEGYMNVYFDALKKEVPITVGTVSDDYSLDFVTFNNGIEFEATGTNASSPSGTTPPVYKNVSAIKYKIGDQAFEMAGKAATAYSFAQYENVKQAELFPFGIFGRDWMKENHAILDYANKLLYFKTGTSITK